MPLENEDDAPEIRVVEEKPAAADDGATARREPRQQREAPRDEHRKIADSDADDLGPRMCKRIDQLRRRQGDAEARAAAMESENRRLLAQVQEISGTALSHYESAALARLDAAKREAHEAYESGDGHKVVEANRKLASAQYAVDSVEQVKARNQAQAAAAPPVKPNETDPAQPARRSPSYSEKTQEWVDDNPWFEDDREARDSAVRIHDRLVRAGYTPDTSDYFEELTRRCRVMFPEHFDEENEPAAAERRPSRQEAERAPRRAPPVAGVNRSAPATTGRRITEVKLTPAMIEAAQIAGVPPKQYAEQVLALRKDGKL